MDFIKDLKKEFSIHSNELVAQGQRAYMRNQFDFYGLTASKRREIQKPLFKKYNLSLNNNKEHIIKNLWNKEQRDYQYLAQELILQNAKQFKNTDIELFEFMITNKSWWDTIDFIAPKILGEYFKLYPQNIKQKANQWISSNNIWLQRSSLLFQLKYKENLNTELLTHVIHSLLDSEEFFVNKAIGWILREYSKTNSEWVCDFIDKTNLSKLSNREGLKFIKKVNNN